jgi:alcohol dehydrogenase (cytochrome c)
MRGIILAAILNMAVSVTALAQNDQDLRDAGKRTDEIITYGMSYTQQRFSPLKQINRDTVRRLVPAWSYSMANNYGEEAQPLIKDGVIYVTGQDKTVAIEALTGKEIWKTMVEYPPETTRVVCCGIVNRGAALYQGRVFRVTLDARVIALDQKTGKEIWSTRFGDPKFGVSGTGAPLVANGVVIIGAAGANSLQHMSTALPFQYDAVDAASMEHMGQKQAGRTPADDSHLRSRRHLHRPLSQKGPRP